MQHVMHINKHKICAHNQKSLKLSKTSNCCIFCYRNRRACPVLSVFGGDRYHKVPPQEPWDKLRDWDRKKSSNSKVLKSLGECRPSAREPWCSKKNKLILGSESQSIPDRDFTNDITTRHSAIGQMTRSQTRSQNRRSSSSERDHGVPASLLPIG